MQAELQKVRNEIPLYNQTKQRLYKYFITKEITSLVIKNDQYMKSLDFVYINSSGLNQNNSKAVNSKQKKMITDYYREKFHEIYLFDLKSFAELLVDNLKKQKTSEAWFYIEIVHQQILAYKIFMHKLFKIFRHIDGNHLKLKGKDIHIQGVNIFKKYYIQAIYPSLFEKMTQLITIFKQGQHINTSILRDVIYNIAICGFNNNRQSIEISKQGQFSQCIFQPKGWQPYETFYFKEKFTTPMVQHVEKMYRHKSLQFLKLSTPEYVSESLKSLAMQQKIANLLYDNDSPRKVIVFSVSNILANQNGKVVMDNQKTGVYTMLQGQRYDQLNELYTLIKQSDLMPYLSNIFQRYIDKQGTLILEKVTPQDERQLKKQKVSEIILKLLELKDLADFIVIKSFCGDIKLQQGRDTAFHTLINKTNRVTNFLCYYADSQLRKQKDDSEAQTTISGILKLFRYIYSTDAFFKTYQKLLSMRVLSDNFKNKDMETDLISQLKTQAGAGALSKITTMINDISNSQTFYEDVVKNDKLFNKDFDFKLMILTSGSWPIFNPKSGHQNVPAPLIQSVKRLDEQYSRKFPGKVLNWIFSNGSALISVKFKTNTYMLTVGGFQLLILLQFSNPNVQSIKVEDVSKKVKAEQMNNFNASILNLAKLKILIKDGEQGRVNPSNKLTFNQQFSYKHKRVNCVPTQKTVQKVAPQFNEQILKQRQVLIDSIIVKVMKARKIIKYQQCVTQTIVMCKVFKAELSFIKRRIQALIQKQFLKRDEKQSNMLIYTP